MEDLRNGLFKIGQSQTPEKRESTLQSEVPETTLRFYIPAHDTAEQELHEKFSKKRVRGEWFGLAPEDLLSVIDFLKRHGDLPRASVDYDWLGKISFGAVSSRPGQPEISDRGDKDVAQVAAKVKLEMPK